MEILTFSAKQLNVETDRLEKWGAATVTLTFYKGNQFTDRRPKDGEQSPFDDVELVYEGVIEETDITYEEKKMYDVWRETKDILEEREYSEEDNLDGTNEMIAVSRLDKYYSRNNIKTDLDDNED